MYVHFSLIAMMWATVSLEHSRERPLGSLMCWLGVLGWIQWSFEIELAEEFDSWFYLSPFEYLLL